MTLNENELDNIFINRQKLIEPTPIRDSVIYHQGKDGILKEDRYLQIGKSRISDPRLITKNDWESILRQRQTLVSLSASILLLIGLIFGGWGTVYAAQDSLPNESLYSVKLIGENLELSFTSDSQARISLLTIFANRRMEEAATLALQGEPIPDELPALMDEYLEELATLSTSMDEETLLGAITGIHIHKRDQDQDMTGPKSDFDPSRKMCKKGQDSTQISLEDQTDANLEISTTTITTTVISTLEVTVTVTITPGNFGPGPCEMPGTCTPPVDEHSPGLYESTNPGSDDYLGFGPGSDQGFGPYQPSVNPLPGNNEAPKQPLTPPNDSKGSKP